MRDFAYYSTRADAIKAKERKYYTGKPCRNGHLTYRYTVSSQCAECCRARAQKHLAGIRALLNGC